MAEILTNYFFMLFFAIYDLSGATTHWENSIKYHILNKHLINLIFYTKNKPGSFYDLTINKLL